MALLVLSGSVSGQANAGGPAAALYARVSNLGLDAKQVYNVRGAALDREDMHIALDDGTIAFTETVNGRVTGALFDGEGTVLIVPPNQVERHSLGMFTDSAVMNQAFTKAYFRFDDSRFVSDLQPYLRPMDTSSDFVEKENSLAKSLAGLDALRLIVALTRVTPSKFDGTLTGEFIHAHFVGAKGTFDASWDTGVTEQIAAGQSSITDHGAFYDQWMLFPMRSVRQRDEEQHKKGLSTDAFYEDQLPISKYKVRSQVKPPTELSTEATVTFTARKGGDRTLLFELSRNLKLSSVTMDAGSSTVPLEFIQNQAIEGTQLAKRGNDVIAIILPEPLVKGQGVTLNLKYAGDVLSDAGGGLLYVGDRGTWYPNRGPTMSDFELEFEAPVEWKLLATGKLESREIRDGREISKWRSERPIPLAGFNLGRYTAASAKSILADTEVTAYAAKGVEKTFPIAPAPEVIFHEKGRPPLAEPTPALPLMPAGNAGAVAEKARDTIDFLTTRLGPFPYHSLLLTQIPGPDSQGWPGLIYLSGHVFLTPAQRAQGRDADYAKSGEELIYNLLMEAHETAHQWWGDAVLWQSYRDQWLMEALANYCALLQIESHSPAESKALLDYYRKRLLTPGAGGAHPRKDAGPVTFGLRLNSAPFPGAYESVAYGRGTWLIHMLREMLRDAAQKNASREKPSGNADPDALFYSVLRNMQRKYSGKVMSTQDLQLSFEEVWPDTLRYENKKSLDWFFEGWVNGTAIPKYELRDVRFSSAAGKTVARAILLQKNAPDSLVTPVPVYAQTPSGLVFLDRVFADGNETPIKLSVPAGTKKLLIDPHETVLTER